MCLLSVLYGVAAACTFACVSRACDLSFRDQLQLIQIGEAVPAARASEVTSLAGEEVECASLGSFWIVRHQGELYFLDPQRAFHRWSRTGVSFTGGPSRVLEADFYLYRRSDTLKLWREFGRGRFTVQELASLSSSDDVQLPWNKIRLLDRDRYRAAIAERASAEEEQTVRLLLFEKARWYIAANEPDAVQVVDISPGEILHHSSEVVVTVSYRQKEGAIKKVVLRVPINPAMAPYVGYPTKEETDVRNLRKPLTGGGIPPQ